MQGAEGLARVLKTDLKNGLDETDFDKRAAQFGDNVGDKLVPKSFWTIFAEAMGDIMLKILLVCAVVSIVFESYIAISTTGSIGHAWVEGFAIFLAVFLVAGSGSFVDWRKEIQFVENRKKTMLDLKTTVIRKGKQ